MRTAPTKPAASSCSTASRSTARAPGRPIAARSYSAYDFWWHLGHDTLSRASGARRRCSSTASSRRSCSAGEYGHAMHVWDLRKRKHLQTLDLGPEQQMVLELRPAHDPRRDLRASSASSSRPRTSRPRSGTGTGTTATGRSARRSRSRPSPPTPTLLPPLLQGFGAVPPLITDINLSLDDRFLYVSCWGTGRLSPVRRQRPVPAAADRQGAAGRDRLARPRTRRNGALTGGPQMVEVSRDGSRIYVSNSLYSRWDRSSIPTGLDGWIAKLDAAPDGGLALDPEFLDDGVRRPPSAPDPPPRRRRLLRLVLLPLSCIRMMRHGMAVHAAACGACHGLEPGNGLAVRGRARRFQDHSGDGLVVRSRPRPAARSRRVLALRSARSPPVSRLDGADRARRGASRRPTDTSIRIAGAAALAAFALWRIVRSHRHPRWVGMRLRRESSPAGRS